MHKECRNELVSLISGNGKEKIFLRDFNCRVRTLSEVGVRTAITTDGFENLKGKNCADLYSMRFKQPNIRILFSDCKDGTLLLLAFFEKEGKGVTEYEAYIPCAKARLQEMIIN